MDIEKIGKYEVHGFLGKGAMGKVYRGRDPVADRVVAIKTILIDDLDSEKERKAFRTRFQQEIRISARLIHPHIVILFDTGEHEGTPYIVMEYVEGTTLARLLADQKQLPLEDVVKLTRQIASALDAAHQHQIVHRDIKPENIMVTTAGDAKLTDFGVAKILDPQKTRSVGFMGTPRYASPEQICDTDIDHRSDIFTFGIVVHELLTGKTPFTGSSIQSILFKIAQARAELAPPHAAYGLDKRATKTLFEKVLNVSPDARFDSASAFAEAVADLCTRKQNTPTMQLPLADIQETVQLDLKEVPGEETAVTQHAAWQESDTPSHDADRAPATAEWEYRAGQRIGAHYIVEEPLARGPLGPLYKVRHTNGSLEVLRVVDAELVNDEGYRLAFARDLENYRELRHPHLLPITHVEQLDTFKFHRIFYTLPFVAGGSLAEHLQRQTTRDEKQILQWLSQLASCLEYLHSKDVVHRNLRPGNLYLGPKGNLRLGEPGLSLRYMQGPLKHMLTQTLNQRGAHYFLPPEEQESLFLGRDPELAPSRDVCAFGLTAYALLANRPPSDQCPSLADVMADRQLGARLDPFLAKCRARQPADRFRDAADMTAAFHRILQSASNRQAAPFDAFDASGLRSEAGAGTVPPLGEDTSPPPVVFSPQELAADEPQTPRPAKDTTERPAAGPPAAGPPAAGSPAAGSPTAAQSAAVVQASRGAGPVTNTGSKQAGGINQSSPPKSKKKQGAIWLIVALALVGLLVTVGLWMFRDQGSGEITPPPANKSAQSQDTSSDQPEPTASSDDAATVEMDDAVTGTDPPPPDEAGEDPAVATVTEPEPEATQSAESEPSPTERRRQNKVRQLNRDFDTAIQAEDLVAARQHHRELSDMGASASANARALSALENRLQTRITENFDKAETNRDLDAMSQYMTVYVNLWADDPAIQDFQTRVSEVKRRLDIDNLQTQFNQALTANNRENALTALEQLDQLGQPVDELRQRLDQVLPDVVRAGTERIIVIAGLEVPFVWIPPGRFTMGSSSSEDGRNNDEYLHPVNISKGFWIAKTETTQALWRALTGENPSGSKGANKPVEQVSWRQIEGFLEQLNAQTDKGRFRLPTEAEWEYSARAGTRTPYAGALEDMGWHADNSGGRSHDVAQKQPNPWGLYDMHGNVSEWVFDRYDERYYLEGPQDDPQGPSIGSARVHRGGCFSFPADDCRSASRFSRPVKYRGDTVGFRLVYQELNR